ncbi:hypothetical protein [Mycobacterium sp. TY815]|uniref:hypothetical protein n=1 Tax=Mycobacterium sp. TY815 TaxID=3050581 RepID=UPI0027425478|nr:hypothetical protein [Mycobacterium sp. TY815]MDP7706835.1 hypothetical protein [Mycobacterium sp. TY815]
MIFAAIRTLATLAQQIYHVGQLLLAGPDHPFATRELAFDSAESLTELVHEQGATNALLQDIRNLLQHIASAAPFLPQSGAAEGPAAPIPPGVAGSLKPPTYAQSVEDWSAVRGGAR